MENFGINKLKLLEEIIKEVKEIKGLEPETDRQYIKKIENDEPDKDDGYFIHTNKFNVLLSHYWNDHPDGAYGLKIFNLKNNVSLQFDTKSRNGKFSTNIDPEEEIFYVALKLFYEDVGKRAPRQKSPAEYY